MHGRTALVTVTALAALLTACGGGSGQGSAEGTTTTGSKAPSQTADCGPGSGGRCSSGSASPTAAKPDTELAVGDAFAYQDGLKVQVTGISRITRYGEYDEKPAADKTAFRVAWTVTNGTDKPYDLDNLGYDAKGATSGGETEFLYVEVDSKQMTGRLAPAHSGRFTSEYAIARKDADRIVFTMSRLDAFMEDDSAYVGEDPHWTGAVK
ncbi:MULTISPECIES: hypothetical protein [unclassified Streptomyces]|uniref:hypothetical protein n=1 Tax=unclassified Streptomyces TaxID=2593676 RepID=UPI001F0386D7|nr:MULTISPECIES: hypothetical protein [unclassified Streptomyces]MCH0564934.1 hypothetical protein [Streptomyces sp. MUM 2J]MCH0569935.1 hypothetical protein [Streptomyces sp. MUM 136J]